MRFLKQTYWHQLFEAGVFLKALNSVWEIAGGLLLLTTRGRTILNLVFVFFSRSELVGGRDDFIFQLVTVQLQHLSVNTRVFVGVYLLFHGIMNMFLAYNLYRNRLWAYPFSIAFVSLFFTYQVYRLAHTHSLILLAVSVFDLFFIILTWHEYRYQLKKQHAAAAR